MVRMKRTPYRLPKKVRVAKSGEVERKPHRWKPGTGALFEIRRMQTRTDTLLPRDPFRRVVRGLASEYRSDYRFQADAFQALQEAAEAYVVQYLAEAYKLALLEKKVTLMPRHMQALRSVAEMRKVE